MTTEFEEMAELSLESLELVAGGHSPNMDPDG